MSTLRSPNESLVCEYLHRFDSDPAYQDTEAGLRRLFGQFPKNDRLGVRLRIAS